MAKEVFLEFKYIKNRIMDLGNGERYDIPYRMEPSDILGYTTTRPVYNLDKIHRVKLLQEKPELPRKETGMSDRLHQELCDEAYKNAMDNRRGNEEIRRRLNAYVESGTIEIVNDPFRVKTHTEGEEPQAEDAQPDDAETSDTSETQDSATPKTSNKKK